jgi:hypothetical protein
VDWNNDGKKDLISGQSYSGARVNIFLNTGTDAAPVFSGKTYLQTGGVDFQASYQSTPFIVDWNNDGKKDVLCGEINGRIYYLENTGTDAAPVFSSSTFIQDGAANLVASSRSSPMALDWDHDGAKDLIVGCYDGKLRFYRNIGTDAAPTFNGYTFIQAGGTDIDVGYYSRLGIGDLNHDGCPDLFAGSSGGTVKWYPVNPLLTLTLPESATEGDGVLAGQGSVSIDSPAASSLVIALASEDTSEVTVPASVTITTGNTNATFDLTVVNDADLDGSQLAPITASETLLGTHRQRIRIDDNESTTLSVTLPASVTEGDGTLTGQGTVSLGSTPDSDILVTFSSDDTSEITANPTTIPAGQTSAAFDLVVVDDGEIDGSQTATITAHVPNWTDGADTLSVLDNENMSLTVVIPSISGEGDGVLSGSGTVTISGTLPSNLVVSLVSDDTSEITVPTTTTINTGNTSAPFDLTVINDPDSDGQQVVSVSVSASGFTGGNDSITVADNEIDRFEFGSISSPQTASEAFSLLIQARDINGDLAWYQGTLPITASGDSGVAPVQPSSVAFSDGAWSGAIQVDTVDTGITLFVTAGGGHDGTSAVFSTTPGALASFTWDPIPSPRYENIPFSVSVSAQDANGYLVTDFTGTADLTASVGNGATTVGSGSSAWNYPLSSYYHDARTQVIYLGSELGAACRITKLALDVTVVPGQTLNSWTIRMKHTTLADYAGSALWENTGWTTVYQADETISSTGWVEFEFSTPFDYNGTDNLMIDFCFNNTSWTRDGECRFTSAAATRSLSARVDSTAGDPLTWSGTTPAPASGTQVPNIRLTTGTPIACSPSTSGNFTSGLWSGDVTVEAPGTNVALAASWGGASGTSATFNVDPTTANHTVPHGWLSAANPSWATNYEAVVLLDQDGDGALTWQEFLAGTDPMDAASVFRVFTISGMGSSNGVTWYGTTDSGVLSDFIIYRCTNILSPDWVPVGTNSRSATGTNSWWDANPPPLPVYYRLGIQ